MGSNLLECAGKAALEHPGSLKDLTELDFNVFEVGARLLRRGKEALEDTIAGVESLAYALPVVELFYRDYDWSKGYREHIMNESTIALLRGDIQEAKYQFRRETVFSSVYSVAKTPEESAARTGITAIESGKSPECVYSEVENVWQREREKQQDLERFEKTLGSNRFW